MRSIAPEVKPGGPRRDGWNFYVTVRRDSQVGFLAGPFSDYAAAALRVNDAREAAIKHDPFCVFDRFGVSYAGISAPGKLNPALGLEG